MDWEQAIERWWTPNIARIRESVDIAEVLVGELEVELDEHGRGLCPFHADRRPSFDVYRDRRRAGCWSCGWHGDVVDIIRQARGCSLSEALRIAERYAQGSGPPPRENAPALGSEALTAIRDAWRSAASDPDRSAVGQVAVSIGLRPSPRWLVERWWLGDLAGEMTIPYFTRDRELMAVKTRKPGRGSKPICWPGSRLDHLYGIHLDEGQETVIVCEGESDTWTVDHAAEGRYCVLGLPGGALRFVPAWAEELEGRRIVVMFDADDAGARAAARWRARVPCEVIVPPRGDVRDSGSEWLEEVLDGLG